MSGCGVDIVVLGLSLSSSWGNGHATTYRSLLGGLHSSGHRVHFLEREVPWYAGTRDLPEPDFCRLDYYSGVDDLVRRFCSRIVSADAVIVGSYVPDGIDVIDAVATLAPRRFCFYDIDTPVTLARLERHEEEYLARRQIPLFDIYFSFTGGPTLTRLEQRFGARRAAALYCSVDERRYENTGEPIHWDLGYLGTYSPDRQRTLERLLIRPARRLPQMRFVVAGPLYPQGIEWPQNVERIEHLPPARHASFYSRQRFTLNITRAEMIAAGWSPSVRLFEAAACSAPIISDAWKGIDEILPAPRALRKARSSADVVETLTRLSEGERLEIGATGRACVLERHTGAARARELVQQLVSRQRPTAHPVGEGGGHRRVPPVQPSVKETAQ